MRTKLQAMRQPFRWILGRLVLLLCLLSIEVTLSGHLALAEPDQTAPPAYTAEVKAQVEELFEAAMKATNKGSFAEAEQYWTEALEVLPENPAIWSNRGNSKVSQGKFEAALVDYDRSVELAPDQPDAYLNRGAVQEGLLNWEAAIADYNKVLDLDPKDAAAYNNRGNAKAGQGNWNAAIADYEKATELSPQFAFARGNYALALYQIGERDESIRTMRNLIRKYPQFADMRAAITAALWDKGQIGEAESNWVAAIGLDSRYKDTTWLAEIRRWPPALIDDMESFLSLAGQKGT